MPGRPRIQHKIKCTDCPRSFKRYSGRTRHMNLFHRPLTPPPDDQPAPTFHYQRHPHLTATPCNINGNFLPPFLPPIPPSPTVPAHAPASWQPFENRHSFEFVDFHFTEVQSSKPEINRALDIWAASVVGHNEYPQWANADEVLTTIDNIQQGHAPFKTVRFRYQGPLPTDCLPPKWMTETYELCYRDSRELLKQQLACTDFRDQVTPVPYRQFDASGDRTWSNLMSADWAWKQADIIAQDPETHGAMFVPVISGSDKTTVSVATGHQEYHPVYQSPGVITNIARRAHGDGVLPNAFLPIPKANRKERDSPLYQKFARQLYHTCLAKVYQPLKKGMTIPEVIKCWDGHYRKVIYGLGPYIADYPEQVWLACIVQGWCPKCTNRPDDLDAPNARSRTHVKTDMLIESFDPDILWSDYGVRCDVVPFTHSFPRADIHELLSPDLLHQVIKGTFKDHLVDFVSEYIYLKFQPSKKKAKEVIDDIDRRISAVPVFPGLRRFPDGRDFKQWTGDDSKALMKVYIAAIAGHVPSRIVKTFSAFMDFCYIARRNSLNTHDLGKLEDALKRFHEHREVFIELGIHDTLSLPRQHALSHYPRGIRLFGALNGLCSSITESKHIKAVKEPWRRSNRYNALSQMVRTLTRLGKLSTLRRLFRKRGMLFGTAAQYSLLIAQGHIPTNEEDEEGSVDDEENENSDLGPLNGPKAMSSIALAAKKARGYPNEASELATFIEEPRLVEQIRRFLWFIANSDSPTAPADIPLEDCPEFTSRISVFHSAVARYYSPSDICGAGGMLHARIRSNPNWHDGYPRYDTVFVETDSELPGMRGLTIGRVRMFFSFHHDGMYFPCVLVNWYNTDGEEPDADTGMWMVKPEYIGGQRSVQVIHLNSIARGAHLMPIYGTQKLDEDFHFRYSLDAFPSYFVNPYVDHHVHEFLSE